MKDQIQFLGSELKARENLAQSAKFQIIPCPMEKTVSYGEGHLWVRKPFWMQARLERSSICAEGIFTRSAVDCTREHHHCLNDLKKQVSEIVSDQKFPVILGGEHSLTWAAVNGIADALDEKIGIVQVDAHADLRDCYEGNPHSHASVMNLLVKEGHKLVSLGVRAICEQERNFRDEYEVISHDGEELVRPHIHSIDLPEGFPERVYVSFDLDGLDPSIVPAVGTPVPGGFPIINPSIWFNLVFLVANAWDWTWSSLHLSIRILFHLLLPLACCKVTQLV